MAFSTRLLSISRLPSCRYALNLSHRSSVYTIAFPMALFGSIPPALSSSASHLPRALTTGSDFCNLSSFNTEQLTEQCNIGSRQFYANAVRIGDLQRRTAGNRWQQFY